MRGPTALLVPAMVLDHQMNRPGISGGSDS
jgi:hypothetical protein